MVPLRWVMVKTRASCLVKVRSGAAAEGALPVVEAEAVNHEGGPVTVTLATLGMSVQPQFPLVALKYHHLWSNS